MRHLVIPWVLLPLSFLHFLFAQTPPASEQPASGSSISGRVFYAATKAPVPNANVMARSGGKTVAAKTDAQGNYTLKDVAPGSANVSASAPAQQVGPGSQASRRIQIGPAQDLIAIDLRLPTPPQIKGRVIDQNKEPVPGMFVMLVTREYSHGALRYVFSNISIADDEGNYTIARLEPGRAYLLLARRAPTRVDSISNLPDDPAMRKRLATPTFYPGTTALEAAQPISLRDGEIREGMDIPVVRAPSLCMDGHILAGGNPGAVNFSIAPERPTFGVSGNGGMYGNDPLSGKTGPDGAIRACGLTPGTYTITVDQEPGPQGPPAFYGTARITVTDTDVHDVAISARPLVPVPIEVELEGPVPAPTGNDPPPQPKINVSLQSVVRSQYGGEKRGGPVTIPGSMPLDGVLMDDYFVSVNGLTGSLYTKDITYDGVSVMRGLARVGNAPANATLRIVIGQDAGFVQAKVTDKNNNPVADSSVTVFPASAITEADIAITYVTGQTDQLGAWKSPALAPGKYFVLATTAPPDRSPEAIGKLIAARRQIEPVDIAPGASVPVSAVQRIAE